MTGPRVTGPLVRRRAQGIVSALLAVLALVLCGTVAACGGDATPSAPVGTPPATLTSPVDGRVIRIDAEALTKVKGFTLRTDAGAEIVFTIGVLENGTDFPPGHLAEHMATSSAVRVSFHEENGSRVVYRLEDAAAP